MRIYVTGAKGLVGQELVRVLEAGQHRVAGHEEVEIREPGAIGDDIAAQRPDWVIHLAAYTRVDDAESHPEEAARTNVTGTVNVASAARVAGARLLYMSTDYVYDGERSEPYVETDPPRPLSVYGLSKLAGEYAALTIVGDALVVRGGWLYGCSRGFVDTILAAASRRPTLQVVTDEVGCPTYVPDLARGLLALIEAGPEGGIIHLANEGGTSRFELARAAIRLAGGDPDQVQPTTQARNGRPARRPPFSVLSCARYSRIAGSTLRPWERALADYLGAGRRSEVK